MGGLNHQASTSQQTSEPATGTHHAVPAKTAGDLRSRLIGRQVPEVQLQCGDRQWLNIANLAQHRSLIMCFYAGAATSANLDRGAQRAAQKRAVAWASFAAELADMRYEVLGVSAQSAITNARFVSSSLLPYVLLSDPRLELARHLDLPSNDAQIEYEPLTVVMREQRITGVFYPVDPANDTATVTG